MEHTNWGSPEKHAASAEAARAKPFEILTNQVPETAIQMFMKDEKLMTALELAHWPTDEDTCEVLAAKQGLGAEQIAAISKYQKALTAEREEGSIH